MEPIWKRRGDSLIAGEDVANPCGGQCRGNGKSMMAESPWKDRDRGKFIGMDELWKWNEHGISVAVESLCS